MPSFRTTRKVAHPPERMFDLVADVERYPEFLPFCKSLVLRKRSTDAEGREVIVADMAVGYKAINERFTSRVTLDRGKGRILVEYIDGPFSFLENKWTFLPDTSRGPQGASVDFFITYEFRSRMLAMLAGAVFDRIFRIFAEAFEGRADQVYGRPDRAALAQGGAG